MSAEGSQTPETDLAKAGTPVPKQVDGQLAITWPEVTEATSYELVIADGAQTPLDPQPSVGDVDPPESTTKVIALAALDDLTAYSAKVRAVAGQSFGPWSDWSSPVTIDKSRPATQQLSELLDRLRDAPTDPILVLDAEVLDARHIYDQISALLNKPIQVHGASIHPAADSVRIDGQTALLGRPLTPVSLVFVEIGGALHLQFDYPLGAISAADLRVADILPPNIFSTVPLPDSLAHLTGAKLTFATDLGRARVTADALSLSLAAIGIDGATLALGPLIPQFDVIPPQFDRPKRYRPRLLATANADGASPLDVFVDFPAGTDPWRIGLAKAWRVHDPTALAPLLNGQSPTLPDGVRGAAVLTIERMVLAHSPGSSASHLSLAATLGPPAEGGQATWGVVPDVPSINLATMALDAAISKTPSGIDIEAHGRIGGVFTIGSLAPIAAELALPGADGTYVLTARTDQSMLLADTAQLMKGDAQAISGVMGRLGTLDTFRLRNLALHVAPATRTLSRAVLDLAVKSWTIDKLSWFRLDDFNLSIDVRNPTDLSKRAINGAVSGILTLGTAQLAVTGSYREDGTWSLTLAGTCGLPGGLSDLKNLVKADSFSAIVPPDSTGRQLETDAFIAIRHLSFDYDSQKNYFPRIALSVALQQAISLAGDIVVLDAIDVDLQATRDSQAGEADISGHISAGLSLGGARFHIEADRKPGDTGWWLSGALVESATIPVSRLMTALRMNGVQTPTADQFPGDLTVLAASIRVNPSTGALKIYGETRTDWSFAFGATPVRLVSLAVDAERPGNDDPSAPAKAMLRAGFEIGTVLTGVSEITLGGASVDTVMRLAIDPPDPGAATSDANGVVAGLTGQSAAEDISRLVPSAWPLGLTNLGAVANLQKNAFLLRGSLVGHGWAYALVLRSAPPAPGSAAGTVAPMQYVFAAGLKQGFKFKDLNTSLEPLDHLITVRNAHFAVYCSLDQRASTLQSAYDALGPHDFPDGAVWPLAADEIAPLKGLRLAATFDLSISGILEVGDSEISALIDRDRPGNSRFAFSVPRFTVWAATFELAAAFVPAEALLTFDGKVTLTSVPGGPWEFSARSLTLTDAGLVGKLDLLNASKSLNSPLQLPVQIEALQLDMQKPPVAASTRFALIGKVRLGQAPTAGIDARAQFSSRLDLVGTEPTMFSVTLDQDLDIGAFLAQFLTGDANDWRKLGFIDIGFQKGSVIYYLSDGKHAGAMKQYLSLPKAEETLSQGLHVLTWVKLTLIEDKLVFLKVDATADGGERFGMISATGELPDAIPLGFMSFAGKEIQNDLYGGAPSVGFRTGKNKAFTLSTGINIFRKAAGLVEIDVAKGTAPAEKVVVSGKITSGPSLGKLGNLSLRFRYARTDTGHNLSVSDWPPLDDVSNLIDIMKAIYDFVMNVKNGKVGCGQIVELLSSQVPINTRLTSEMPTVTLNGADVVVTYKATCSISFGNTDGILPKSLTFEIRIPSATTFSELPNVILDQMGKQLAEQVLADAQVMSMILGVAFARNAVTLALNLICREATAAAVSAGAEAAVAAVASTLGIALILGKVKDALEEDDKTRSEPSKSTTTGEPLPYVPVMRDFKFADGAFTGKWHAAPLAAEYDLEVSGPGMTAMVINAHTALAASSPIVDLDGLTPGAYRGRARGRRAALTGDWSAPLSTSLVQSVPPVITLASDGDTLSATATLPDGHTARVLFSDPAGKILGAEQELNAAHPMASTALSGQIGNFGARATRKVPGEIRSVPSDVVLRVWAPPSDLATRFGDGKLQVSWRAEANASCQFMVTDASDQPFRQPPNITMGADPNSRIVTGLPVGETIALTVWVKMPASSSRKSRITRTLSVPDAPTDLDWLFDGTTLTVTWKQASALKVVVNVGTGDGRPLAPAPEIKLPAPDKASITGLPLGRILTIGARTDTGEAFSAWTQMQVTLITLDAPDAVEANFTSNGIAVRWSRRSAASDETGDIEVLDDAQKPLSGLAPLILRQESLVGAGGVMWSTNIRDARFAQDRRFSVRVRPHRPHILGIWTAPVPVGPQPVVQNLPAPQDILVRLIGDHFEISCTTDDATRTLRIAIADPLNRFVPQEVAKSDPMIVTPKLPGALAPGIYRVQLQSKAQGRESPLSPELQILVTTAPVWQFKLHNDTDRDIEITAHALDATGNAQDKASKVAPGDTVPMADFSSSITLVGLDTTVAMNSGDPARRLCRIAILPRSTGVGRTHQWSEMVRWASGGTSDRDLGARRTGAALVFLGPSPAAQIYWLTPDDGPTQALTFRMLDQRADARSIARLLKDYISTQTLAGILIAATGEPIAALESIRPLWPELTLSNLLDIWGMASSAAGQPLDPCTAARFPGASHSVTLETLAEVGNAAWGLSDRLTMAACAGSTIVASTTKPSDTAVRIAGLPHILALQRDEAAVIVARIIRAAHILTPRQRATTLMSIYAKVLPPPVLAARAAAMREPPASESETWEDAYTLIAAPWRRPPELTSLIRCMTMLGLGPPQCAVLAKRILPQMTAADLAKALKHELDMRQSAIGAADPDHITIMGRAVASSTLLRQVPGRAAAMLMAASPGGLPYPHAFAATLSMAGLDTATLSALLPAITPAMNPAMVQTAIDQGIFLKGLYP